MQHTQIRSGFLCLVFLFAFFCAVSYLMSVHHQPSMVVPRPRAAGSHHLPVAKHATVTREGRPRGNSATMRTSLGGSSSRLNRSTHEACADGKAREHLVFIKTHKTGSTTLMHITSRFGFTRRLSFVLNRARPNAGHMSPTLHITPKTRRRFLPPLGRPATDSSSTNSSSTTSSSTNSSSTNSSSTNSSSTNSSSTNPSPTASSSAKSSSANSSAVAGGRYDILNIHLRHNKKAIDTFMAQPARYVTILRDPGYQFESAFVHFHLERVLLPTDFSACHHRSTTCFMRRFLAKPVFYRRRMRRPSVRMVDNGQIFDLGLDRDKHGDPGAVEAHIARLDSEMDLVLITEYFDESLLLLRRLLCWDWSDIVYLPQNVRSRRSKVPEQLRQNMRKFNSADMRLYEHFNKTLWRRIEQYGPGFRSDLEDFRAMLNRTARQCTQGTYDRGSRSHPVVIYHEVKPNASSECALIAQSHQQLSHAVWGRQNVTSRK